MARKSPPNETVYEDTSPHPFAPKKGRPEIWGDELLNELADNITEWSKRPDSLMIAQWEIELDLTCDQVTAFLEKHKRFRRAHEQAKKRIGIRRFNLATSEKLSERIYLKEQWNYCPHTRKREDERDNRKAEHQVNLLKAIAASDELVNAKDPESEIPLAEQE